MSRELTNEEKIIIDSKVEKFLNEEVFGWDIINEDKNWDGEGKSIEEKIIIEIIKVLEDRINYY